MDFRQNDDHIASITLYIPGISVLRVVTKIPVKDMSCGFFFNQPKHPVSMENTSLRRSHARAHFSAFITLGGY